MSKINWCYPPPDETTIYIEDDGPDSGRGSDDRDEDEGIYEPVEGR